MSEIVDSSLKKAVKGTLLVFGGTVVGALFWFATKVLIVRSITKEELGIYSIALAVAGVVATIAMAGLPDGITRFVSTHLVEGRRREAEESARAAMRLGWLFGLVSTALTVAVAGVLSDHFFYKPELVYPLRILSLSILFTILPRVMIGVLRGHGMIKPQVYYYSVGQPVFFLLFLTLFLFWGLGINTISLAFVLALVLCTVGVGAYSLRKLRFGLFSGGPASGQRDLLRFSLPLVGATIATMVYYWTDTVILGRYDTAASVGVYNVSSSLAKLLSFIMSAVGFVMMPVAGELYSSGKREELGRVYQVVTKWAFASALPLFFVLFFFPGTTITFLFGGQYAEGSQSLRLLSLGYMADVFAGCCGALMIVAGMSTQLMNIAIIGAVLNTALNYVFIKHMGWGVNGASAATTISLVLISWMKIYGLHKKVGMQPLTWKYIKPSLGAALVGILLYACAKLLPFNFWMMPLYLVLFIIGYGLAIVLTGSIEREDLMLYDAVSRKTGVKSEALRGLLERALR